MDKKIEFITEDPNILELYPPRPIKDDMPEWLNKVDPELNEFSIKHCPPAMDWISSGYIIYNVWEYLLEDTVRDFKRGLSVQTMNTRPELRITQPSVVSKAAMPIPDGPFSYFRLESDFKVVTPPGYSCLVMQPYYDFNSQFKILPGIIDTDKHDWVISSMAYTTHKKLSILPGEKLFQIIPFKRDNWKMEAKTDIYFSKLMHYINKCYKKLYWSKKSFK
jgi:hypothetical protein